MTEKRFDWELKTDSIVVRAVKMCIEDIDSQIQILAHIAAQEPEFWPKIAKYLIKANELLQVAGVLVNLLERKIEEEEQMLEDLENMFEELIDYEEQLSDIYEPNEDFENWGS
jgi:lipopolysaccharide biosynthesis regulator YciM